MFCNFLFKHISFAICRNIHDFHSSTTPCTHFPSTHSSIQNIDTSLLQAFQPINQNPIHWFIHPATHRLNLTSVPLSFQPPNQPFVYPPFYLSIQYSIHKTSIIKKETIHNSIQTSIWCLPYRSVLVPVYVYLYRLAIQTNYSFVVRQLHVSFHLQNHHQAVKQNFI